MNLKDWFKSHKDIDLTITHPKTKAGHKTNIEMTLTSSGALLFREMVTYNKPSDDEIVDVLNSMYLELRSENRKETL